jgi:hypothetical protein
MKNRALKSVVQILATLNKYCNLKTSKIFKTWHFILCYSKHTKANFLAIARTQKENTKENTLFQEQQKQNRQSKYYRVASHKAFSL